MAKSEQEVISAGTGPLLLPPPGLAHQRYHLNRSENLVKRSTRRLDGSTVWIYDGNMMMLLVETALGLCPKSPDERHAPEAFSTTDDDTGDIHCRYCGKLLDPLPSSPSQPANNAYYGN